MTKRLRQEKDALGAVRVPYNVYYGVQTKRATDNFRISGIRINNNFVKSYAIIKKASAKSNLRLGKLNKKMEKAISKACDELHRGKLISNFVVDVYQAGAGTSTNMNINEIIANRANELLGGRLGKYKFINPHDHINMSQSTNDTFHACVHITAYGMIQNLLLEMDKLEKTLKQKSNSFKKIVKVGRTHLQDAVPITLGDEFSGYAYSIDECKKHLKTTSYYLLELSLGGTAVGTKISAGEKYSRIIINELNRLTRTKFKKAGNFFCMQQNQNAEIEVSGALKSLSVAVSKISNDIILMSSGPNAGIFEISLPAIQPGSSMMPGKTNPSICEMMNMVCLQVIGNDVTITEAARSGQLELNVYMPLIAHNLLFSVEILTNGIRAFREKCVRGIEPNKRKIKEHLEKNALIATALISHIGYDKTAEIVKRAYKENKSVKEIVLSMKIMPSQKLDKILDTKRLAKG